MTAFVWSVTPYEKLDQHQIQTMHVLVIKINAKLAVLNIGTIKDCLKITFYSFVYFVTNNNFFKGKLFSIQVMPNTKYSDFLPHSNKKFVQSATFSFSIKNAKKVEERYWRLIHSSIIMTYRLNWYKIWVLSGTY